MNATTRALLLLALVALPGAASAQGPDGATDAAAPHLAVHVEPAQLRLRPGGAANVTLVLESGFDRDLALQVGSTGDPAIRVVFAETRVKLPANARVEIPATVKLAPDAQPGERVAMLGAHEVPSSTAATAADRKLAEGMARLRVVTPPAAASGARPFDALAVSGAMQGPPPPEVSDHAIVSDAPPAGIPQGVLVVAGAGAAVGAGALTFGWLRRHGWWILAPLYTRIARSRVLDQPTREALADLVEREPGITFSEAQRKLGIGAGTMTHHARMLEAAGVLFSSPDGQTRRLFLVAGGRQAGVAPLHERLLRALQESGPMTSAELARRLHVSRQALHYHVKRLRKDGRLHAEGEGKDARLHAA